MCVCSGDVNAAFDSSDHDIQNRAPRAAEITVVEGIQRGCGGVGVEFPLLGYGEEGEAKECGDGGGGKWSHARIQQLLEETKVGRA